MRPGHVPIGTCNTMNGGTPLVLLRRPMIVSMLQILHRERVSSDEEALALARMDVNRANVSDVDFTAQDAIYARGIEDAAKWLAAQANALRKLDREPEKREAFIEDHNAIRALLPKHPATEKDSANGL